MSASAATFSTWPCSSATPATPEPDTAWYVATTSASSPASSCSGFRTGIAAIVVQFGLAMMPLGRSAIACGFTSETTRGTCGSLRHAEELSITTAPCAATFSASALEVAPPAENSTMSRPE